MYRAHPAEVPEVVRGPSGWIGLLDFPSQRAGLSRQGGHEAVYGCGLFHVPEEMAAAPAGDVAPVHGIEGEALQRFLAFPTDARFLRASMASPTEGCGEC